MVNHDPPHICPFKSTSSNWYAHQISISTILTVNFSVQCQVFCLHPYGHLWFTIVNRINMLSVPSTYRPIRLPDEGHLRNNVMAVLPLLLVKTRKWIMMVLICFSLMCLRRSHASSMNLIDYAFVDVRCWSRSLFCQPTYTKITVWHITFAFIFVWQFREGSLGSKDQVRKGRHGTKAAVSHRSGNALALTSFSFQLHSG